MYALVEKIEIVLEFVCFFSFLFFFLLQISMQESGPVCVSFRLFINNAIITIFFLGVRVCKGGGWGFGWC